MDIGLYHACRVISSLIVQIHVYFDCNHKTVIALSSCMISIIIKAEQDKIKIIYYNKFIAFDVASIISDIILVDVYR